MIRVLLVEDDPSLGEALVDLLEQNSFLVDWKKTVADAKDLLNQSNFDLLILDIGLPDGTGLDLAHWIKDNFDIPFIFMTAMNTAENRLEGFELGAEEFIPKPFHFKELLLRVDHVLKAHKRSPRTLTLENVEINFEELSVQLQGEDKQYLSKRDFELLKFLIDHSPKVVSREEILDQILGENQFPSLRTVDNSIVRLRQALGDQQADIIRSIRGIGYQWQGVKYDEDSE